MEEQIKLEKLQKLFLNFPISDSAISELNELKNQKYNTKIVTINTRSLEKHIPVSSKEISDYLKLPENKKRVESVFNSRQSSLSTREQVKASHILIKSN